MLLILSLKQQIKATAKCFYQKLVAADSYKPAKSKINANIVLVKPTENYTKLGEDYGLSEVSYF